jgi:RNA polymerase sigma-70 factor, ECF subfamily
VRSLSPKERQILRLHFLDGLDPEAVAKMFHVHRTTVVRWIQRARQTILDEPRRLLQARLALPDDELDSLVAHGQSQLALTMSRVFGDTKPSDGSKP